MSISGYGIVTASSLVTGEVGLFRNKYGTPQCQKKHTEVRQSFVYSAYSREAGSYHDFTSKRMRWSAAILTELTTYVQTTAIKVIRLYVSFFTSARILLVQGSAEIALLLSLRLISQVATVRWEGFGGFVTDACRIAIGFFSTVNYS